MSAAGADAGEAVIHVVRKQDAIILVAVVVRLGVRWVNYAIFESLLQRAARFGRCARTADLDICSVGEAEDTIIDSVPKVVCIRINEGTSQYSSLHLQKNHCWSLSWPWENSLSCKQVRHLWNFCPASWSV